MSRLSVLVILAGTVWGGAVSAHHSFAAYYGPSDPQGLVVIDGIVQEFQFTNPHGILVVNARRANGEELQWTVETLAPAMLRRSGWTKDSLKRGEHVLVQGWAARDGSRLVRLQTVKRDDGTQLGGPKR